MNSEQPNPPEKPKRRPRYRGTHPRRYEQKYKELNPERYADEVQKVLASGKTPAGSHRSILVNEILEVLRPQPGEIAVDATLGHGGHAKEILQRILPGGKLLGIDADPIELPKTEMRLRNLGIPSEALVVRRSNFAGLPQILAAEGISGADVILADLGVSSMQIDNPARGFTFKCDGPLDLRMNPGKGEPASALLAKIAENDLRDLLISNADEPKAELISAEIAAVRQDRPIATTAQLAQVVRDACKRERRQPAKDEVDSTIRRVFQALRVAVNDEFGALDALLRNLPFCLRPGGRAAFLTFHSGEDRRVKQAFRMGEQAGFYSSIAPEVIRPSHEELRANPRSSSAKLRWAVRSIA